MSHRQIYELQEIRQCASGVDPLSSKQENSQKWTTSTYMVDKYRSGNFND
jgi:hypothetical protein